MLMDSKAIMLRLATCFLFLFVMVGCSSATRFEIPEGVGTTSTVPAVKNLELQQTAEIPTVFVPKELLEEKENLDMAEQVTAQVILYAADGSSILDSPEPITAQNIAKYRVSPEVIAEASHKLEQLGFKVVQAGPTSLSIASDKALFERVFQTKLEVGGKKAMDTKVSGVEAYYYEATEPVKIPGELRPLVAGVLLPTPPELFP